MNKSTRAFLQQIRLGWGFLAMGVLFIAGGIVIRLYAPASGVNPKWFEAPGILFAGWGGMMVARYLLAGANLQAAHRLAAEESDERSRALRSRAGNAAFTFWMVFASLALVSYSLWSMNQGGFDLLWIYMALAVITPGLVYTVVLVWLHSRY
jgi:hypothetical protein